MSANDYLFCKISWGISNKGDVREGYMLWEILLRVIYFGKSAKDYLMKEKSAEDFLEDRNIRKDYFVAGKVHWDYLTCICNPILHFAKPWI